MTNKTAYKPTLDNVLIKPDAKEAVTAGGIVLAGAQTSAKTGVIIACGPGREDSKGRMIQMPVQVGDRVAFGEFAGRSDLPEDPADPRGPQLKLMNSSEILAILVDGE